MPADGVGVEALTGAGRFTPRPSPIGHVVGLVLLVGGAGMLVSAGVEAIDGGPEVAALAGSGALVGIPGVVLWRVTVVPQRIRTRQIFSTVTAAWVALSIAATVPYLLTGTFERFDDALFESIAGITTTGASVLSPIEATPAGVLFFRSMTQWFGGMGVIVLAVAVLPFLGFGGMALLQAEAPGPSSERIAPRVRETARRLWALYLGLTVGLAVAYAVAGMSPYDAVNHSFTTVSTGGFSTKDASIAHFGSAPIEWIAIAGMFLAGGNFALYFQAVRGRTGPLLRSPEFRVYAGVVVVASALAVAWGAADQGVDHQSIRDAAFSINTVVSTTGFATVDFAAWVPGAQSMLFVLMFIGGMSGSTAGGFKMIRVMAILGYAVREIRRQAQPRLVAAVRIGRDVIAEENVSRIMGFSTLYLAIAAVGTAAIAATGEDLITSASALAASLGNVGPGLAEVGPTSNFLALDAGARGVSMVAMLLGRLEVYPVLLGVSSIFGLRPVKAVTGIVLRPVRTVRS